MAKKEGKVYLGYEDESITETNRTLVNHAVNKIGGLPVGFYIDRCGLLLQTNNAN